MSVFLVTWDINKKSENYQKARTDLIAHLKKYPHIIDQGLDSVWFIESQLTANDLCNDIRKKMSNDDRLIVTKLVTGQHQGWLAPDVWDWINRRI